MRGGGDSDATGAVGATDVALKLGDEMPFASPTGRAGGGVTLIVDGAGAHVEQQTAPCAHAS